MIIKTRKEPKPSLKGNVRHVYLKDWKGERIEPSYNGLLHAYYGYPRFADWILTDPEELDSTAVFVASEASNYINGTLINVDGDWMAW